MRLLRRSSMGRGGGGGGGGGRGLRRVDSLPRSPMALAPRASLAKSESIKKRDRKKGSRRARLREGISAALRELHLGGGGHHRAADRRGGGGRGGGGDKGAAAVAPPAVGVPLRASPDAETRPAAASAGHSSGGRRSWALAVALVLVLACVVALGRGPAICCCTCAAWWCGGRTADDPACRRRWSGGGRHSSVQPQAGCLQQY